MHVNGEAKQNKKKICDDTGKITQAEAATTTTTMCSQVKTFKKIYVNLRSAFFLPFFFGSSLRSFSFVFHIKHISRSYHRSRFPSLLDVSPAK